MEFITSDNFVLSSSTTIVENSTKAVVFTHGITANKEEEGIFVHAATKLNVLGFSTILFDFRGHGASQGNSVKDFTISGQIKDIDASIQYLKDQGITWIGLAGASFGGGAASLYASTHQESIQALLLAYPVLDYDKAFLHPTTPWTRKEFGHYKEELKRFGYVTIGESNFKAGNKLFEEMKQYKPCEALNSFNKPVFIIHGDKDSYIAYQDVLDCYDSLSNYQKHMEIIKGAEHGLSEEPYETKAVKMIVKFFQENNKQLS